MKKAIKRGLVGFPQGIAIGQVLSIVAATMYAPKGEYSIIPALVNLMGSEINAMILQTVLWGTIGSVFSASSVIWEKEEWSITKQTVIHFAITTSLTLVIAYSLKWITSIGGLISYVGIFVAIYAMIWGINYVLWRNKIKKVNSQLNEKQR